MNENLFEQIVMWQQGGDRRSVDITLGGAGSKDEVKVWCYDYTLMDGVHVKTIEDVLTINLTDKNIASRQETLDKMDVEREKLATEIRRLKGEVEDAAEEN